MLRQAHAGFKNWLVTELLWCLQWVIKMRFATSPPSNMSCPLSTYPPPYMHACVCVCMCISFKNLAIWMSLDDMHLLWELRCWIDCLKGTLKRNSKSVYSDEAWFQNHIFVSFMVRGYYHNRTWSSKFDLFELCIEIAAPVCRCSVADVQVFSNIWMIVVE